MKCTNEEFEKIKERVRAFEGEKRFAHTVSVVKEAEYIAKACGFSTEYVEKSKLAAVSGP